MNAIHIWNCTFKKLFSKKKKKINPKILSNERNEAFHSEKWLQQILSFYFHGVSNQKDGILLYIHAYIYANGSNWKISDTCLFSLFFGISWEKKIQFSDLFALCHVSVARSKYSESLQGGKKKEWTMNEWKICENNKRWFSCSLTLLVQNGKHPF